MIISNQDGFTGNILMAVMATVIAVVASISFMHVVTLDTNEFHYLQDKLQQELFMRSENSRIPLLYDLVSLSSKDRKIKMVNSDRVSYYWIRLKSKKTTISNSLGLPMEDAVAVQALITQKNDSQFYSDKNSPVVHYMEKLSNRQKLSQFAYFSDNEASDLYKDGPNARVKFYGKDELFGPVHSNTDIWIQGNGGGSVNTQAPGWPLFHGMVTTAGKLMNHATNSELIGSSAPIEAIFQGPDPGYAEEVAHIPYIPTADLIRKNGIKPYGQSAVGQENKIYNCEILGASIKVQVLDFTQIRTDTFVVYKRYPDALHPVIFGNPNTYIQDSLWTNVVTLRDTTWGSPSNYSLSNKSMYLPGVTWVKGSVSGKMTIGTAKDAYTTGNITLAQTTVGQMPLNPNSYNRNDYFGLVSEGKIIIKYKYRKKLANGTYETYADNSQGPNGHVWLYGSYAALGAEGDGDLGFLQAGTLTYEYQHPHGAVMPYRGVSQKTGQDTLYKFIDLHRHRFPPAPASMTTRPLWHRWPNQTPNDQSLGFPNNSIPNYDYTQTTGPILYKTSDYPWYNPVWPEKDAGAAPQNLATDITWERGTLHIIGSIAQRRRGFIHRSGTSAANNNPDTGIWDPPLILGPPHRSTGYEKDYRYDDRLTFVAPPDFPEVYKGYGAGAVSAFNEQSWGFKTPPKNF